MSNAFMVHAWSNKSYTIDSSIIFLHVELSTIFTLIYFLINFDFDFFLELLGITLAPSFLILE